MTVEAPLSVLNTSIQATKPQPERDKELRRQASSNPILTGWSGAISYLWMFYIVGGGGGPPSCGRGWDWLSKVWIGLAGQSCCVIPPPPPPAVVAGGCDVKG